MKSKKLLLVGVAAMGLAAVGVGGVSSLAWYQTTQSINAVAGTAAGYSVTVNGPADAAASFDYTINCTITDANSGKALILSTWVTSAYKSYTLDAGLQKVEHTPTSGEELVKVFTVRATGVWGASAASLTPEAKAAILAASTDTYTVTFSKGDGCAARAMFVTQANNTIGSFNNVSNQTLTKAVKDIPTDGVDIGYLLVRVEGENVDEDVNVADTGTFSVVIDAAGSIA